MIKEVLGTIYAYALAYMQDGGVWAMLVVFIIGFVFGYLVN